MAFILSWMMYVPSDYLCRLSDRTGWPWLCALTDRLPCPPPESPWGSRCRSRCGR